MIANNKRMNKDKLIDNLLEKSSISFEIYGKKYFYEKLLQI